MDDTPAAEGLYPSPARAPQRPCPCRAHAAGQPCPCQPLCQPPCQPPCQSPVPAAVPAPVGAPGRPLPDLMAVRLTEVPDSWPPYDDEVPAGDVHAGGEPGGRGDDHGAGHGQPGHGQVEESSEDHAGAPGHREDDRGRRGGGSGDADADRWPSQFAQVLAETLAGSRPASQITPWTTERARAHIKRLGPLLAAGQRPRVQRVLTSRPMEDVVEVAVIVGFGSRTRALAARLERAGPQPAAWGRPARQAHWLCTAVESA
jgi:Family of unknown function (DUF6459)